MALQGRHIVAVGKKPLERRATNARTAARRRLTGRRPKAATADETLAEVKALMAEPRRAKSTRG